MHEIDIHTHQFKSGHFIQVINTFAQDLPFPDDEKLFSAGIHPWHLGLVDADKCLHSIELAMSQKNLFAVGECGLDRTIDTDFSLQEHYFRKQVKIAEKYSKPLIIHCVRAFPELIRLKKDSKSPVPWIIHGFHGNQQSALQLVRHNFYFSAGEALLTDQLKKDILKLIPADRLFLETDDRETSISEIYLHASQILKIGTDELSEAILKNFKNFF